MKGKWTKTRGRKYALRSDTIHRPQLVGGEDAGSDWTGERFCFFLLNLPLEQGLNRQK